ncbi:MAG: aminotransferase class IV [Dehalococcoidales bacterium]|nr:aminotransferase class IV [Dehalococcoidales bacterium]
MEETVYLNGELLPRARAFLSINDYGFLYGFGLYETMRARNGKVFLLERHLARLMKSAKVIGLADRLKGVDFGTVCQRVLAANGLTEARLRITVSGGEGEDPPWKGEGGRPTLLVTARPYVPPAPEKYERGYRLGIATVRRCTQSVIDGMKTIDHLASVMARMEAASRGLDEALLLNDDGFIAEGGGCNIFFVRDSRLVTPSLGSGILPGVTRELVIELARGLGITATEGTVGIGVIRKCQEAFVTNAVMGIMPVTEVRDAGGNSVTIGEGKPGEITRRLMQAYSERLEKETG